MNSGKQISHSNMEEDERLRDSARAGYRRPKLLIGLCAIVLVGWLAFHAGHKSEFSQNAQPDNLLQARVHELELAVEQLKQEQAMPAIALERYRNSVGYIDGTYRVGFTKQRPEIRVRFAGTGFLAGNGLVVTNRHVAEPWYKDSEAQALIARGGSPTLENLVIFFPNSSTPVRLSNPSVSSTSDLAILRAERPAAIRGLAILPLAQSSRPAGQPVILLGYPMGVDGMVAKSPAAVYEHLASRHKDIDAAPELAAHSLIRPSATWGHLGDIVGNKLIYDAATAHGASGGPVINSNGEVIGVNSGYMEGFSGGSFGVSVEALRTLLLKAESSR